MFSEPYPRVDSYSDRQVFLFSVNIIMRYFEHRGAPGEVPLVAWPVVREAHFLMTSNVGL